MLKLLTAPVTNDRGPRYMERALAAIHEANRHDEPITLIYATTEGRAGLFVQFADHLEERATGPIAANYPNCALTTVERFGKSRVVPSFTMSAGARFTVMASVGQSNPVS